MKISFNNTNLAKVKELLFVLHALHRQGLYVREWCDAFAQLHVELLRIRENDLVASAELTMWASCQVTLELNFSKGIASVLRDGALVTQSTLCNEMRLKDVKRILGSLKKALTLEDDEAKVQSLNVALRKELLYLRETDNDTLKRLIMWVMTDVLYKSIYGSISYDLILSFADGSPAI